MVISNMGSREAFNQVPLPKPWGHGLLWLLTGWLTFTVPGIASAQMDTETVDNRHECLIEPMVVIDLGSETAGVIDELLVGRGDKVFAGEIVARLKSDVEARRVAQAARRSLLSSEITARRADLELAEQVLQRADSLHGEELASSQQRDEARAQYLIAQAALDQAMESQQQNRLELLLADSLLAQRTVRSPVNGVVVETRAHAGEFVHDNPVMTIAQLNPLRVEVVLPLAEYGKFEAGDTAVIEPETGGPAIEAIVDLVDPLLDSESGTFGLRILIDNASGELLAGQKCVVSLSSASRSVTVSDGDLP